MIIIIEYFLIALALYFALGLLFGIYFVLKGAQVLDDGVRNTPWHFRLIILPGSIMLWLPLLIKIIRKK